MARRNDPKELYLDRIFDAPLARVWDAWTDPKQVAKWWGPRGFSITTHSRDLRTGGTWDYTMHGPDGTDYPNVTRYLEVEPHKRLVYDHGGSHDRPALFRVTVTFEERDGKTHMAMIMALATPEAAAETKRFIKQAGGDATWDRLAEYLADDQPFVINRSFDAPIERLFEMWTDPQHVAAWMPPTGFTMEYRRADIRTGGSSFARMQGGDIVMYAKVEYLEVRRPDRIVYTQAFADEHEGPGRHPLAPTWPRQMRTVVTLTPEEPNRTRVTVTWTVEGDATAEERATFAGNKASMTGGWTGSFDKLEAHLAAAPHKR